MKYKCGNQSPLPYGELFCLVVFRNTVDQSIKELSDWKDLLQITVIVEVEGAKENVESLFDRIVILHPSFGRMLR